MTILSGIGGTGAKDGARFDEMDDFQIELNIWDEILTNFRAMVSVPSNKI